MFKVCAEKTNSIKFVKVDQNFAPKVVYSSHHKIIGPCRSCFLAGTAHQMWWKYLHKIIMVVKHPKDGNKSQIQ